MMHRKAKAKCSMNKWVLVSKPFKEQKVDPIITALWDQQPVGQFDQSRKKKEKGKKKKVIRRKIKNNKNGGFPGLGRGCGKFSEKYRNRSTIKYLSKLSKKF